MPDILFLDEIQSSDADLVGGKGLSLAVLKRAGLPVPDGFCITTEACRRGPDDSARRAAVESAYRRLGMGRVAVRSSATAEDGESTSFAGQQETILGVEGLEALAAAVERCRRSIDSDRARAYRAHTGTADTAVSIAIVVQRMVEAASAGVLFTTDPLDSSGRRMRIEASWGVGESVVSGRVMPDRFVLDRDGGAVIERHIGTKQTRWRDGRDIPTTEEERGRSCLSDTDLSDLAILGHAVERHYGSPRDIEWAIADGHVYLLQARPITVGTGHDRERIRKDTMERLRSVAGTDLVVWSRTNLIEILAEPTPMSWALVSGHLLSGGGGTGRMYRALGFSPDPAMAGQSAYDLIGGRPYLNLQREPRLQGSRPVYRYPFEEYRKNPSAALQPKPKSAMITGFFDLFRLPARVLGMLGTAGRINAELTAFPNRFRTNVVPTFVAEIKRAEQEDLKSLTHDQLVSRFHHWVRRTLHEFAGENLRSTLLAQYCWELLQNQLKKPLGAESAATAVTRLAQCVVPEADADLPGAVRRYTSGRMKPEEFFAEFGHRGSGEMELARPRWREVPNELSVDRDAGQEGPKPLDPDAIFEGIAKDAKWPASIARWMRTHFDGLRTHLALRESGKHRLMRGYAEIRRILLELDGRYELDGGVFYLLPDELEFLSTRLADLRSAAASRRKDRSPALSLEVPAVLFSDDLEVIGRPLPVPTGSSELTGVSISSGTAEGQALVLTEPDQAPADARDFVLVCPSTDPAWVPLFAKARGLVMESGGTLSHGAIVAREFGLPGVAGIPDVHRIIKTGMRIRVDGSRGAVVVLSGS